MHERYSHPALLFVAAYALWSKRFIPYILVSITILLNIESVFKYFNINNYRTLIWSPDFIACLYRCCIVVLYFELYRKEIPENQTIHPIITSE